MTRAPALLLPMLLAGCIFGSNHEPPRKTSNLPRPKAYNAPSAAETRQCLAELSHIGVAFNPLPDRNRGGGCSTFGTVQLLDVGLPTTNLGAMRCGLAKAYAGWVRSAVAPAAHQILGSDLVKVETFGTYACRATVGTASARLSGHAIANAVDVAAFDLADGRRISILGDWNASDPLVQQFLQTIHQSACKRFGTVLSPDYNGAHRNHLHLEDDRANFCR